MHVSLCKRDALREYIKKVDIIYELFIKRDVLILGLFEIVCNIASFTSFLLKLTFENR